MSKNHHDNSLIGELLQEICASYYLMPSIEKYLCRILGSFNSYLSLIASTGHYYTDEYQLTITRHADHSNKFLQNQIEESSQNLIKKNFNRLNKKECISYSNEMNISILPIIYKSDKIGLLLFYKERKDEHLESEIYEFIGSYITAAFLGHNIIKKKSLISSIADTFSISNEISVKKLLDWRLQEIIEGVFKDPLSMNGIYQEIFRQTEKTLIHEALKQTDKNQTQAAKLLGINRNTLRKKMKELNIT